MHNKSIYEWVITGVKWYGIIVIGGILFLGRSTVWLLHDVWCGMTRIDVNEEYIIGKSARKQCIMAMMVLLFGFVHVFNIILIVPILMGLQHLVKTKSQGLDRQQEYRSQTVKNVKRWYDGIIYAAGVDPMFRKVREMVAPRTAKDSKVIDIACGTGALVFCLAERCKHVTGVDHSLDMINYANKEKRNKGLANVEFVHADATNLSLYQDHIFDYAVLSMTIHEMPQCILLPVLKEATRVAEEVMIVDWAIPMPMNIGGIINLYLEFIAGYDNLRDFLSFRDNRGLDGLIEELELTVEEEASDNQGIFRFVKTRKT